MDDKHIHAVNTTGEAFKDALTAFVEISRKQADRGALAINVVDAMLTGTVATEEMQRLTDLAAKHSPPKESEYAPPGKRPTTVVPARTAANGAAAKDAAE